MSIKKLVVNKKLVVKEFMVENERECVCHFEIGLKYTYFYDPETEKYYQPKSTFEITGENLEDSFEEITNFYE